MEIYGDDALLFTFAIENESSRFAGSEKGVMFFLGGDELGFFGFLILLALSPTTGSRYRNKNKFPKEDGVWGGGGFAPILKIPSCVFQVVDWLLDQFT